MSIVNRDLDPSQQIRIVDRQIDAAVTGTGATVVLALAEAPCQVVAAGLKAFGLSGSPVWSLNIWRALAGGPTLIGLGATVTVVPGTSAVQGISITLGATASCFMQTGDLLLAVTGAANTAVTTANVNVTLKMTQDVRTFFGVQAS